MKTRTLAAAVCLLTACSEAEWQEAGDTAVATATVDTFNTVATGRAANRLLRDAPKSELVRLQFFGEHQDRLGNPTPIPLYDLVYSGSDLAAAKLDNLDAWQTINLASGITITGERGRAVIAENCDLHPILCSEL